MGSFSRAESWLDERLAPYSVGSSLVGLLTLFGFFLLTAIWWLLHATRRWARQRGRMGACAAGALRLAAANGDLRTLAALAAAEPTFQVDAAVAGFTALLAASAQGEADAVVWLLHHGADVHATKQDGWLRTALHLAAARGSLATAKALLAFGADPAARDALGHTPGDAARLHNRLALGALLDAASRGSVPLPSRADFVHRLPATAWVAQAVVAAGKAPANTAAGDDEEKGASGLSKNIIAVHATATGRAQVQPMDEAAAAARARAAAARAWEGLGSQGCTPAPGLPFLRFLAVTSQTASLLYLVWRALFSLRPGWAYLLSVPLLVGEAACFLVCNCFLLSVWSVVQRLQLRLDAMLPPEAWPAVDVYVVAYNEPLEVVEPTVIAAVNLEYPGDKLTVHVLDDGGSEELAAAVQRLGVQARLMGRRAKLEYVARQKKKGVPHHAKAGNINSCLLGGGGSAPFVLVLDCDMIVHPEFLLRVMPHFFRQEGGPGSRDASAAPQGKEGAAPRWVLKEKLAFVQTPQDFWNVSPSDPLMHAGRFFYGPQMQGRDGIGACPCCGTGVVFQRSCLVSIGGQALSSVTEDANTSLYLLAAGFSTIYLNERLSFGLAPVDVGGAFAQRLRWSMGSLQIMQKENPMQQAGLTVPQRLLFWEAGAYHYLSLITVAYILLPLIFCWTRWGVVVIHRFWMFAAVFTFYYGLNRFLVYWAHREVEGGMLELWRGAQSWVWLAPNHLRAIWRVHVAEMRITKWICSFEIGFAVTSKDLSATHSALRDALAVTWPHLLYYALFAATLAYAVVTASVSHYTAQQLVAVGCSLLWGALACLCLWPPISTLLPKVETKSGWQVRWDVFHHSDHAPEGGHATGTGQHAPATSSPSGIAAMLHRFSAMLPAAMRHAHHPAGQGTMAGAAPAADGGSAGAAPSPPDPDPEAGQWATPHCAGSGDPGAPSGSASVPPPAVGALPHELRSRSASTTVSHASAVPHGVPFNIGCVAMPHHTARVLHQSSLLTSVILPEHRQLPPAMPRAAEHSGQVLLELTPDGDVRPMPGGGDPDAFDFHWVLDALAEQGVTDQQAPAAALDLSAAPPLAPASQPHAHLTSIQQSAVLMLAEAAGLVAPGSDGAGWREASTRQASAAEEPPLVSCITARCWTNEVEGPSTCAATMAPPAPHPAHTAAAELGRHTGVLFRGGTCEPSTTQARAQDMARQLAAATALLPGAAAHGVGSGCGGAPGSSLVLPVQPASIYEHSIAARPNFQGRHAPASSWMWLIVHLALLAGLVVSSLLREVLVRGAYAGPVPVSLGMF